MAAELTAAIKSLVVVPLNIAVAVVIDAVPGCVADIVNELPEIKVCVVLDPVTIVDPAA